MENQNCSCGQKSSWGTEGVALRDYLAAKAMAAYISDSERRQLTTFVATARIAYSIADAMLEARKSQR